MRHPDIEQLVISLGTRSPFRSHSAFCGLPIRNQAAVKVSSVDLKESFKVQTNTKISNYFSVRFEVFMVARMKNAAFWDVVPHRSRQNRRFRGTWRLHLQGRIGELGTLAALPVGYKQWFCLADSFYPEGGDTFLSNVGSNKTHAAPHPRRRHSLICLTYHAICYSCDERWSFTTNVRQIPDLLSVRTRPSLITDRQAGHPKWCFWLYLESIAVSNVMLLLQSFRNSLSSHSGS
jgi:hypothetical protein